MSQWKQLPDTPPQPARVSDTHDTADNHSVDANQLALPLSTGIAGMRAAEASDVKEQPDAIDANAATAAPIVVAPADAPFGQRLRAARDAHGWSCAEVAARLKLPAQLIARIERDDYTGLTEGVFLRGYLASYARLVGIPADLANRVAAANTHAAPLVATGTMSHSRYLFERFSVSATYLVLTAIIVVPAVWLATHGGLEQNLARTTPLDPPAHVATIAPAANTSLSTADPGIADVRSVPSGTAPSDIRAESSGAPAQVDQSPVIASMAPFASAPATVPVPTSASPGASATTVIGAGAHTLKLNLNEQSWVEITAADGHKLEYGMLAAHSEHTYRSDGPISLRLGNAQGAEVLADGALVDLAPYQRSNVATVKLFASAESGASHVNQ